MSSASLDSVLKESLTKLNKPEQFDTYLEYMHSEWLQTVEDLTLASQNEMTWQNLKIPARLKLELIKLLPKPKESEPPASVSLLQANREEKTDEDMGLGEKTKKQHDWVIYYSTEHEAYYYYNTVSFESSWECPDDTLDYEYVEYTAGSGEGGAEGWGEGNTGVTTAEDGEVPPSPSEAGGGDKSPSVSNLIKMFSRPKTAPEGGKPIFHTSPEVETRQKTLQQQQEDAASSAGAKSGSGGASPMRKASSRRMIKSNIYQNSDSSGSDAEEEDESPVIITPKYSQSAASAVGSTIQYAAGAAGRRPETRRAKGGGGTLCDDDTLNYRTTYFQSERLGTDDDTCSEYSAAASVSTFTASASSATSQQQQQQQHPSLTPNTKTNMFRSTRAGSRDFCDEETTLAAAAALNHALYLEQTELLYDRTQLRQLPYQAENKLAKSSDNARSSEKVSASSAATAAAASSTQPPRPRLPRPTLQSDTVGMDVYDEQDDGDGDGGGDGLNDESFYMVRTTTKEMGAMQAASDYYAETHPAAQGKATYSPTVITGGGGGVGRDHVSFSPSSAAGSHHSPNNFSGGRPGAFKQTSPNSSAALPTGGGAGANKIRTKPYPKSYLDPTTSTGLDDVQIEMQLDYAAIQEQERAAAAAAYRLQQQQYQQQSQQRSPGSTKDNYGSGSSSNGHGNGHHKYSDSREFLPPTAPPLSEKRNHKHNASDISVGATGNTDRHVRYAMKGSSALSESPPYNPEYPTLQRPPSGEYDGQEEKSPTYDASRKFLFVEQPPRDGSATARTHDYATPYARAVSPDEEEAVPFSPPPPGAIGNRNNYIVTVNSPIPVDTPHSSSGLTGDDYLGMALGDGGGGLPTPPPPQKQKEKKKGMFGKLLKGINPFHHGSGDRISAPKPKKHSSTEVSVQSLIALGFDRKTATRALIECKYDLDMATELLCSIREEDEQRRKLGIPPSSSEEEDDDDDDDA